MYENQMRISKDLDPIVIIVATEITPKLFKSEGANTNRVIL